MIINDLQPINTLNQSNIQNANVQISLSHATKRYPAKTVKNNH